MQEPASREGQLFFGIDARHVRQLGKELVADSVTAVSELIKNAYDADATRVVIDFKDVNDPGGSLTIRDDGIGMSLLDVKNSWMTISTDIKERHPYSNKFGRVRSGRKGIGRFAAESLGGKLTLITSKENSSDRLTVVFDWMERFRPGEQLHTIANTYEISDCAEDEHGTTLIIEGLHDAWREGALTNVAKAILLLQSPSTKAIAPSGGDAKDPGFQVEVSVSGVRLESESLALKDFFQAATAVITGEVLTDGSAVWEVDGRQVDVKDVQVSETKYLTTGPFRFHAYYFIYERTAVGSITVNKARDMGRQYGGVRIYRDGLRILPYGERNNDWLNLDDLSRRRLIEEPIGNTNFFGEVHVSRHENLLLIDTASREGIIVNEAFEDLGNFVSRGLIWGAQRVASVRRASKPKPEPHSGPSTRSEILSHLRRALLSTLRGIPSIPDHMREEIRALLEQGLQEAKEADKAESSRTEDLIGELQLLRILASLGTSIAVFSHEVRAAVNTMAATLEDLRENLEPLQLNGAADAEGALDYAALALENLDNIASYIDGYVSQTRVRGKEPQALSDVLREFVDAFQSTVNRRGIHIDYHVNPPHIRTSPMTRSELIAVLINLLTNSVKAMDREGHPDRRILVSVSETATQAVIRFEDTGHGIANSEKSRIFDPFFTTTIPGETELGTGTGLGLKIVKDTVEAYRGEVQLTRPQAHYVTCFEIRLPLWLEA